jgi:hypothetical protein
MDFCLVKIMPTGAVTSNCFDDVILPFRFALARLGWSVETRINSLNAHSVNILFGSCMVGGLIPEELPANTIIFNLEQLSSPSCSWNSRRYREQLRSFTVWDYSERNVRYLRKSLGLENVVHVPLGYVPEMTRLNKSYPQDIDVLFYGTMNERRQKILDDLRASGVRLGCLTFGYGAERDHAIARSKIILNMHYYVPATLEVPRLGYLWANSKCVVSELQPETELSSGVENACAYRGYEDLVQAVHELLRSKDAREKQGLSGFEAFSRLRQEDFLTKIVGRKSGKSAPMPLPRRLHAGSGKDFRSACLNVDINPRMNPDLVLDLSQPLDPTVTHETARFGAFRLMPGSFERITAFEVLEHVADLPQTMRNFLDLLCIDGELELSVPYELSLGAWQDPTHVRAFNEMSWIYYCEWSWYMGWKDTKFSLQSLSYTLSHIGKDMENKGVATQELLRMPRAIDTMHVVLRKRKSTEEERIEHDAMARNFYHCATGSWSIE